MRIGVDLGGTKIEAVALDAAGAERTRLRIASPRDDYAATVRAIADVVRQVGAACGAPQAPVGVGMPGVIDPVSRRVKNANSIWLNGRALDRDVIEAMARPVRFANDADCFALSEATDGAAEGAGVVFGVILGTGVGGGVVVNGQLLSGPNRIAGEWGHNPLPWANPDETPGPACWCGKAGCIEAWLSGPGLAADHARTLGVEAGLNAQDIAGRAATGDSAAAATLARHAERLARALASVVNLLDPDVVVLGGGLSKLQGLDAAVMAQLQRHAFSPQLTTRIALPVHGDSSGVRGAARLWPEPEPEPEG